MEIGIVTTWFERGAAYVSRAYRDALRDGHRVWIYARGGESFGIGDPKWDTPDVTWAPRAVRFSSTAISWPHFLDWVNTRRLDAVIFNEQTSWDVVWRARRLPILLGAYVDFYTRATVPYFSLYDFLLCNTERHFSVFSAFPQTIYIPWGTDVAAFSPTSVPEREGPVTFFHSCGASPYRKGTDLLLRACQDLKGEYRLILHTQAALSPENEALAGALPGGRLRIIKEDVGPPGLYHLGDVYVYPSRSDGIGLTVCEALAASLAVITTDDGPMNEFVIDGETGRLVPTVPALQRFEGYYWPTNTCDVGALTANMQWYIDHPTEVKPMKAAARRYAEQYRDWKLNAAQLSGTMGTLVRARRPRMAIDAGIRKQIAKERLYSHLDPVAGLLRRSGAGYLNRVSNRILTRILG